MTSFRGNLQIYPSTRNLPFWASFGYFYPKMSQKWLILWKNSLIFSKIAHFLDKMNDFRSIFVDLSSTKIHPFSPNFDKNTSFFSQISSNLTKYAQK